MLNVWGFLWVFLCLSILRLALATHTDPASSQWATYAVDFASGAAAACAVMLARMAGNKGGE